MNTGRICGSTLFQLAGDSTCFPEFMDSFFRQNGFYPLNPMADAGYGSVANYLYCLSHGMNPVMKYNMYARKNTPEFRKLVLCQVLEQLKCPFFCHRLCNNLNNFIACYYVIHFLLIVFFLVFIWRLIFTMGMDSHRIVEAFYIAEYD